MFFVYRWCISYFMLMLSGIYRPNYKQPMGFNAPLPNECGGENNMQNTFHEPGWWIHFFVSIIIRVLLLEVNWYVLFVTNKKRNFRFMLNWVTWPQWDTYLTFRSIKLHAISLHKPSICVFGNWLLYFNWSICENTTELTSKFYLCLLVNILTIEVAVYLGFDMTNRHWEVLTYDHDIITIACQAVVNSHQSLSNNITESVSIADKHVLYPCGA